MQAALFSIDNREIRIRCKAQGRKLTMLCIVIHALHAAFFITAQNQHDLAVQLDSLILQHFKRIKASHGRAFIIQCSASEHVAVHDVTAKGISAPAFTDRHNVQMRQHTDAFFPFPICNHTGIAVVILYLKAFSFPKFQHIIQCFSTACPKRCIGCLCFVIPHRRNGNQTSQVLDKRILVRFQFR